MDRAAAESVIAESRWSDVLGWLDRLNADERAEAGRWYRARLRALAASQDSWRVENRVIQLGLAVALSEDPVEAFRACRWGRSFGWWDSAGAYPALSALLLARGQEWSAAFASLAVATDFRGGAARGTAELAAIIFPVYAVDGTIPEGSFARGWALLAASAWANSRRPDSSWVPLRVPRVLPSGEVRPAYDLPTTLVEVLRSTPRLGDVLTAALRTPDAMAEWNEVKGAGWDVVEAIALLITEGVLDRKVLIDEALAALARADRPGAQRVMAAILRGSGFGGADTRSRSPLIGHLMPSVHGSVTAVLLDAVLDGHPDDASLADVGAVILTRPEKAQKNRMLSYLITHQESATATDLLTLASADEDGSFAGRARAALGDRTDAGPPSVDAGYEWALKVEGIQAEPFASWPPNPAGLDAARSDLTTSSRLTSNAEWLDLAVGYGSRDLAGLRREMLAGPQPPSFLGNRVAPALYAWCSTGDAHRSYTYFWRSLIRDPKTGEMREVVHGPTTTLPAGYQEFTDRLAEETLQRIGPLRELLSTPSRSDGFVTAGDLRARLKRASEGVGPYDLVQALLRLEPTEHRDADAFASISVPVTTGSRKPSLFRRTVDLDAGSVVQEWIRAGGLPERVVSEVDGRLALSAVRLPLPATLRGLAGLDHLCEEVIRPDFFLPFRRSDRPLIGSNHIGDYLGVVPRWGDAGAALVEAVTTLDSAFAVDELVFLCVSPVPLRLGGHRLLALLQSHPRKDSRVRFVEFFATLARQGRVDPEALREQTMHAFTAGLLSLPRLADTWDHAFRVGLMRWVWPSAAAVIEEALAGGRRVAGLADLLRALTPAAPTARAHSDPQRMISALRMLAEPKGSTKAAVEARLLLRALNGERS